MRDFDFYHFSKCSRAFLANFSACPESGLAYGTLPAGSVLERRTGLSLNVAAAPGLA